MLYDKTNVVSCVTPGCITVNCSKYFVI